MSYRRWKQLGPRLRPAPRVALFPFLAVLICTMGALVPLLLAMAHQARLGARAEARARAAERAHEFDAQREAVQWRIEQLRSARQQTEAQWERAQQYLGHLEDHARRLEEEIRQLRREQELLHQQRQRDGIDLDQLRAQIRQMEDELARAETDTGSPRPGPNAQRSYALVPYVGPNRTQRRPIYLECTARAVIVQPEGIRLTAEDFDGPLGASNPLISVVRAAREQMVLSGVLDPDRDGEPYPLLLVRPDGVAAYHYARVALKPWGPDFGYELISAELTLAYPPPDVRLAEVMQTALAQARQVQARLIAAAPRSYGGARRTHTSPADDGLADAARANGSGQAAGGAGFGDGLPDVPPGRGFGGAPVMASDPMVAVAEGGTGNTGGTGERFPNEPARRSASSGTGGVAAGQRSIQEQSGRGQPGANGPTGLLPGQWQEKPPGASATTAVAERSAQPSATEQHAPSARSRNRPDWALPETGPKSTGIVRPIRVELHADRMIVGAGSDAKTIALPARTAAVTDELVAALWSQMESWGIAGKSAHWRPVLAVEVAPGADGRYADLARMLEGSGVAVERRAAARVESGTLR